MILFLLTLALSHSALADRLAVPVLHVRPSALLKKLDGIRSPRIKAIANDENGEVLLEGPKVEIEELRRYASLLDTPALRLRTSLRIICKAQGLDLTYGFTSAHDAAFEFLDESRGFSSQTRSHCNADGTVTTFVDAISGNLKAQFSTRYHPGAQQIFRLSPGWKGDVVYVGPARLTPWDDPKFNDMTFLVFETVTIDEVRGAQDSNGQVRPPKCL